METRFTLSVNGRERTVTTDAERTLLDVLREDFQLTGTKYGCGRAECGACTVLVDGRPVWSCTQSAAGVAGKEITTIEGLSSGDDLHPVQQAFLAEGAMQCGYCTPGMILRVVALLEQDPNPSDEALIAWMNGNLCRCNGYARIVNAIRRAAGRQTRGVTP